MASVFKTISVAPFSPALGAEIDGVNIARGVGDKQLSEIKQAFSDYGVIFFRDQHIT
ncbi:MAG: hypothetical protein HKN34_02460, partial [Gammaproteobacteria bacterium]|nr:hypothetical protein [Gammaproteobacteria bacterium]